MAMKKYPVDVVIYLQNVKYFLEQNIEAKDYFISDVDENDFFEEIAKISEKNLIEIGEPNLSQEQFEHIRNKMHNHFIPGDNITELIVYVPNHCGYSLN